MTQGHNMATTMPTIRAFIELSRVDRFAGTMILFWPFAWSTTMTAKQYKIPFNSYLQVLSMGFLGACLLHSGGCIWNDIIDMDIDAQVDRTKGRPLPSKRITVPQALLFLSVHVILLFTISHFINATSWNLAFITIVPLTGLYPFMKRITYFPQVWLGITLNAPVLIASAVFINSVSWAAMVLAAGGLAWTMWYDTIYACQDKKDDAKAGVKTITLILQNHVKIALFFFATSLVSSWLICGILTGSGMVYFFVTVVGGGLTLAYDLFGVDLDDPKSCLGAFQRNGFVIGPLVTIGFFLDYLLSLL